MCRWICWPPAAPSLTHWFGTDQMGGIWLRAFRGTPHQSGAGHQHGPLQWPAGHGGGASVSLIHPRCDAAVRMVIDAMLALPHMLLLIPHLLYRGGGMRGGDPGGGAHPLAQTGAHSLRRGGGSPAATMWCWRAVGMGALRRWRTPAAWGCCPSGLSAPC